MEKKQFVILSFIIIMFNSTLYAQDTTKVTRGMLVRIFSPSISEKRITGILLSSKTDTLRLHTRNQTTPLEIPLASVNRLEVSRGRKTTIRPVLFTVIGFLGGGAVGITIAGRSNKDFNSTGFISYLLGAGTGSILGYRTGDNLDKKWKTIPLSQLRVGISSNGFILGSQFYL